MRQNCRIFRHMNYSASQAVRRNNTTRQNVATLNLFTPRLKLFQQISLCLNAQHLLDRLEAIISLILHLAWNKLRTLVVTTKLEYVGSPLECIIYTTKFKLRPISRISLEPWKFSCNGQLEDPFSRRFGDVYTWFTSFCQSSCHSMTYTLLQGKLQPLTGKPRLFDYFLWPGSGEFVGKAFQGSYLCLGGVGKIEPEVSGFEWFLFSGAEVANSCRHVFGRDGRV